MATWRSWTSRPRLYIWMAIRARHGHLLFSFRLGTISSMDFINMDFDNLEIYAGMQEVFNKTKMKMDEGII